MLLRWIKCLVVVLLFPFLLAAGNPDGLRLAEERLRARLARDKKECAKGQSHSRWLGPWAPLMAEVCQERKNLACLADRTSTGQLAEVLADIFVDELSGGPTRGQYPPMREYLVVYGEPVVIPLMKRYKDILESNSEYVIRTLGDIGSEKALPLIRSELTAKDLRTVSAAAYAMRMIRHDDAREDLLSLLSDPDLSPEAVPHIVGQLSCLKDPGWYPIVLDLAQKGKIQFQTITDLGFFEKYPESVVAAHLEFLLSQWRSGESDTVACLIFQLHERAHLRRLFPILEDILRAKYLYTKNRYSPLTVKCQYFNRAGRHPLLDRIENTLILEDIEEWNHKYPQGWVSYLYLKELYNKKGGPQFDTGKMIFRLKVSAYDDASDILLGEVTGEFPNGVTNKIKLHSGKPNDEPYRISLTPRLQKDITQNERWTIYIPDFMIDHPVGCGFPMRIPMESRDYKKTSDSGKITRWEVRHIGSPPATVTLNGMTKNR